MSDVNDHRTAKAEAKSAKAHAKAMRPWYKKKRYIVPLGLMAVAANLFAASTTDTDDTAETGTTQVAVTEGESSTPTPALSVTVKELVDALDSNALNAKNTYEDERVEVTGFVGNIDASGNYFGLDPARDGVYFINVQVAIDESFSEQVATFNTGQKVTVTGTVTTVGEVLGYGLDAESIE